MAVDELDNENVDTTAKKKKGSTTPILDNFSRDFNVLALSGKIDPIVGRDSEVKRMAQILSRKTKSNAVLVGEAGTGKSALVEKLALMIVAGTAPSVLLDKTIKMLDLSSLVAGTKYRGQFEERLKGILAELNKPINKNIIIFIDEIHTMVGAGNASGTMDASNILKPALARNEIQCIGATTHDEFKKNIEKDKALSRRFQKIIVNEPTKAETVTILNNLQTSYENFHKVSYTEGVMETIVSLTGRYMVNKAFPDKAIDVLDELGSRKRVEKNIPHVMEELNNQIKEIQAQKLVIVKEQKYEEAVRLRDKERKLTGQLAIEMKNWKDSQNNERVPVTIDDVYTIVADMTGVPINRLDNKETESLLNLETALSKKIIGQDQAIKSIAKAIRRNRVGINDGNRPIGVFFFNGSTGSGKCVCSDTLITVRNKHTNEISKIKISALGQTV